MLLAYQEELERSKLPGYVAPRLHDGDPEMSDLYDFDAPRPAMRLRPTGTDAH